MKIYYKIKKVKSESGTVTSITQGPHKNAGSKHSVEARQKMSEAKKGCTLTEKHKRNISAGGMGQKRKPLTEEHKRKISAGNMGQKRKPLTEEHKRKITEAAIGRKLSEETKRKLSQAFTGRKYIKETLKKMSEAKKGIKRKPFTEEHKRNMSDAAKLRWKSLK